MSGKEEFQYKYTCPVCQSLWPVEEQIELLELPHCTAHGETKCVKCSVDKGQCYQCLTNVEQSGEVFYVLIGAHLGVLLDEIVADNSGDKSEVYGKQMVELKMIQELIRTYTAKEVKSFCKIYFGQEWLSDVA
jgi:hypothetical protein